VTVHNRLVTCRNTQQEDWEIERQPLSNLVTVRGTIPEDGQGYQGWFTVHNPTLFAVTVFREVLAARGISVSGEVVDIDEIDKEPLNGYAHRWTRMAAAASPALTDIITVVNKRSQNFYAEQLLKTLGARVRGQGSASGGAEVVRAMLTKLGISPDRLVMADGSGLSRHNFVSPETVVALLEQMTRHDRFPQYRDSLPLAGVDGTLSKRMVGTTAQGRVMAKTGSLDRVRALSGYALSRDDELFVFSMMVNHYTAEDQAAVDLQDRACQLLTAFSRSGM
jgi:PBP4 family serine-type D-alanyl-D-alanine carboxypeptidase